MAAHAAARQYGRHRALEPIEAPANIGPLTNPLPLVKRKGERRDALDLERELLRDATAPQKAATVATTTGLIMLTAASIAKATTGGIDVAPAPEAAEVRPAPPSPHGAITASTKYALKHPRVAVDTEAAPPPPPPPPPPAPVFIPSEVVPEPAPYITPPPPPPAPVPAPAPPPPAPVASGKAATIAQAALGQVGVWQDCTMLVTNSLAAVGINFHDWPAGYMSLGTIVSGDAAIPGDLIYYADGGMGMAHIAVYIGNGMAVHGGWNGNQTVTYSVNVGSGPVYIRVA